MITTAEMHRVAVGVTQTRLMAKISNQKDA